mmetsp:Transcript_18980/g.42949  ORF Transcript_18980/g.42949 Transcript_18980/m.42949 type:complete len:220 (+) Transcript_18980:109-768(+)
MINGSPVTKLWWIMPPMASMASRPFFSSCSFSLLTSSSDFPASRLTAKPRSPGTRSGSSNIVSMVIAPLFVRISSNPAAKIIWNIALAPIAVGARLESSTCMSWNIGNVTNSLVRKPTVASMATRPCLISASRSHLMSNISAKPRGSKPTSPMYPSSPLGFVRKGSEADMESEPTVLSLASPTSIILWREVATFPVEAGANAAAEPTREAIRADFIMVL